MCEGAAPPSAAPRQLAHRNHATCLLSASPQATLHPILAPLPLPRRLSTIQDAHRIVVVQHGQVAEVGTHEQLLEQGAALHCWQWLGRLAVGCKLGACCWEPRH